MSLENEQREILNLMDKYCKILNVRWNKFKGDVVCRIAKKFIENHLLSSLKVIGPDVYLDGFPYEFDLIISDANAKPKEFTFSFEPAYTHCVIEVKMGGIYSPDQPKRISKIFNEVKLKYPHIKCAYLTFEEVYTTVKPHSKNFFNISKEELGRNGHGFFALRNLRGDKQLIPHQWEKFLEFILR
jgi:hypothetical protein